jgi:hypothetical protein
MWMFLSGHPNTVIHALRLKIVTYVKRVISVDTKDVNFINLKR